MSLSVDRIRMNVRWKIKLQQISKLDVSTIYNLDSAVISRVSKAVQNSVFSGSFLTKTRPEIKPYFWGYKEDALYKAFDFFIVTFKFKE